MPPPLNEAVERHYNAEPGLTLAAALAQNPRVVQIAVMRLAATFVGLFFCYLIHLLLRKPFFGYRRIAAQLKREGRVVNTKVVRRILKELGVQRQVGRHGHVPAAEAIVAIHGGDLGRLPLAVTVFIAPDTGLFGAASKLE